MKKDKEKTQNEDINNLVIDSILEKPITFTLDGQFFYIYPPSIGVSLLASQILREVKDDENIGKVLGKEFATVSNFQKNKEVYIRYIAIHMFRNRKDAMYEENLNKKISVLSKIDITHLMGFYAAISSWYGDQNVLMDKLGILKEKERREKVMSVKSKDGCSVVFGGKSYFGNTLDMICERYKWTLNYLLWGISSINVNMMISDSISSTYMSKEDKKKVNISTDGVVLKAGDVKGFRKQFKI